MHWTTLVTYKTKKRLLRHEINYKSKMTGRASLLGYTMSATSQAFWKRVGLGQRRKQRNKRPKRASINVVMIESCINRDARSFQFPTQRPSDNEWFATASVVVGLPGKVALSNLCWDEDKLKFMPLPWSVWPELLRRT